MILTSIKIVAVDLSYRDTGVCILNNKCGEITIIKAFSIPNDAIEYGFEGMRKMSMKMEAVMNEISNAASANQANVVLVEMPFFSQNAKAAMAVGICWGAIQNLNCILVEPSFIKIWSGSKKGDGKKEVKEKVKRLTCLEKDQLSNDNIVDAVGIGLAFCELININ